MTAKKINPTVNNYTGATIENVSIVNASQANADTRAAIEALASASKSHAEALLAMAQALRGGNSTMSHGINLSNLTGRP